MRRFSAASLHRRSSDTCATSAAIWARSAASLRAADAVSLETSGGLLPFSRSDLSAASDPPSSAVSESGVDEPLRAGVTACTSHDLLGRLPLRGTDGGLGQGGTGAAESFNIFPLRSAQFVDNVPQSSAQVQGPLTQALELLSDEN